MNSLEYWTKREREAQIKYIRQEQDYIKELNGYYDNAMDAAQKEIDSFYAKYAGKEGISLAEAKRRVSKLDIEEYERKTAKYVKDRDFSKQANEEMRLYNLTMKVNRLEMLKSMIGLELVSSMDEMQKYFDAKLTKRTLDEFDRQAGILGKNARQLAPELRRLFGVKKYEAERLMRTELTRVRTAAQRKSFEEGGFDRYMYINFSSAPYTKSPVCEICKDIGKRCEEEKGFPVKDMMPGENAPPMHSNCRCSIAAYMNREEFDKWLENKPEDGEKIDEIDDGKSPETLKKQQKSGIINIEKYEDAASYFDEKYGVRISGFDGTDVEKLKTTLSGVEDMLRLAGDKSNLFKITYDDRLSSFGAMYDNGEMVLGKKGMRSFATGVHETVHSIDFGISTFGTHNWADGIVEKAMSNLKIRKNSRTLDNELNGFMSLMSRDRGKNYERLAYAVEKERAGGKGSKLSKEIYKLFMEEFE